MRIAVDLTQIRTLETGAERVALASCEALASLRPEYEWMVYMEAGAASTLQGAAADERVLARSGVEPARSSVESDLARSNMESVLARAGVLRGVRHLNRFHRIVWQQTVLPDLLRREKVDLLYSPLYTLPLRCPCPTLLYVHDLIALERPDLCTLRNVLHFRLLLGSSIRRAWRVIVPSRSVARAVEARFPRASPAIQVPPGIAKQFLTAPSKRELEATREQLGLPDRFLLAVGRLEPKKNYKAILDALASLRRGDLADLALVVVGAAGPDKQSRARLEQSSVAAHRVYYLPALATRQLRDVYHLTECLLFPSLAEGYGIPPMEAIASRTPCIVSDRTPSYVEDRGVDQWVLSEPTAECLARKIEELLPVRERDGSVAESVQARDHHESDRARVHRSAHEGDDPSSTHDRDPGPFSDRVSFESRVSWARHAASLARVIEKRT